MIPKDSIRKTILSIIATLLAAIAIGLYKFYHEWTVDEKTEESQQFDDANQKAWVIGHVSDAFSSGELTKNRIMDSLMVDKLIVELKDIKATVKHADSMAKLNADQVYLIKEVIKNQ